MWFRQSRNVRQANGIIVWNVRTNNASNLLFRLERSGPKGPLRILPSQTDLARESRFKFGTDRPEGMPGLSTPKTSPSRFHADLLIMGVSEICQLRRSLGLLGALDRMPRYHLAW
jgi:hypothetical protein